MANDQPSFEHLDAVYAAPLHQQWQALQNACQACQMVLPRHTDFINSLAKVWLASDFVVRNCVTYPEILVDLFQSGDVFP